MKNKKAKIALIICFVILIQILVVGCREVVQGNKDLPGTGKKADTVTVTDYTGRQVEVPARVDRIGCLYAFSGHVVAMLGEGDKIVAVVDGLKRDKLLTEMYPSIKNASVPSSEGAINIEELIKANPDIVFIRSETDRNDREVEKLQKSGIPYLVVDYKNIKEQQDAVEMIGQAIGAGDKAKKYNLYYQDIVEKVKARVAGIPAGERITVYHSINEATRTDIEDTLPEDWIRVAGAVNVSVNENLKLLEGKNYASLEQIMLWDPEVIIANETGVADYIRENKQWSALRAVKNGKVYQMPNGISRWGHPGSLETPLAILWTAKTLYPGHFQDINMSDETKRFYKEFFGLQLNDETASKILSGEGMRVSKNEKNKVAN